jgi:ferric-dicitrate binding protein FerR (iron transport regulator)
MPTYRNIDELVSDDSFRAWAEGRAGKADKDSWDRWIQQSDKNRRLARQAQKEIIGFSFRASVTPSSSKAWKRLNRVIEDNGAYRSMQGFRQYRNLWFYGAAAGILIIIMAGIYGLFIYSPAPSTANHSISQKIQTPYGQRQKITFSNGATVVLNAHSTLTYKSGQFAGRPVHVKLKGEAYFSTAKSEQPGNKAFVVQTPDGKISDIGTQFDVSTRGGRTQVVLKEGKVTIKPSSKNDKQPKMLQPGQMAVFNKASDLIHLKAVNPKVYTSWTTEKLIFDHTPLKEVTKRLQYTFGVRVVICEDSLAQRPLSGSIKNTGLSVIVPAIAEALHTSSRIKNNTVYFGSDCQSYDPFKK